jgi:23S rRNA (cytidine1920-2'-O)/16S rRNA (cytidine1409-2'-O)-methyltransferase
MVALLKPQFEAGKAAVDKGQGIIRDRALQEQIRDDLLAHAQDSLEGAEVIGVIDSPIVGTDGNREFLLGLRKG